MCSPACVCVSIYELQLHQQVHSPNTILLLRHFLETLVRIAALDVHEHTHERAEETKAEHKHDSHTHTHTHTHTHSIAEKLSIFLRDFVLPRAKTTKTMLSVDQKRPSVHASVSVQCLPYAIKLLVVLTTSHTRTCTRTRTHICTYTHTDHTHKHMLYISKQNTLKS